MRNNFEFGAGPVHGGWITRDFALIMDSKGQSVKSEISQKLKLIVM